MTDPLRLRIANLEQQLRDVKTLHSIQLGMAGIEKVKVSGLRQRLQAIHTWLPSMRAMLEDIRKDGASVHDSQFNAGNLLVELDRIEATIAHENIEAEFALMQDRFERNSAKEETPMTDT